MKSAQERWSYVITVVIFGTRCRASLLSRVHGDYGRNDDHESVYFECAGSLPSSPPPCEANSVFQSARSSLDEPMHSSHAPFSMDYRNDGDVECDGSLLVSPASIRLWFFSLLGALDEPVLSSLASIIVESLEWACPMVTFVLELLSEIFSVKATKRNPLLGLVSMLISFAALFVCIIELIYRGCKEKVEWRKRGRIYWFFCPNGFPFGTYIDYILVISSILQCVFASIAYAYFHKHADNPIKLPATAIFPIAIPLGLLLSKTFGRCYSEIKPESELEIELEP